MSETGLLPAYLIVGTDGVKRDHAVSRMKARLEKSGMVEFNLDERDMTKDPDIESIIGSLNTFPMGSEFRLVILDGCSKLAKAVSEPLVEYLASPSPTTVCLIIADSLAKNTRLYKAIAKIDKKLSSIVRVPSAGNCRAAFSRWRRSAVSPSRRLLPRSSSRARARTPACSITTWPSLPRWSRRRKLSLPMWSAGSCARPKFSLGLPQCRLGPRYAPLA